MHARQFCTPHLVNANKATALERVVFDDRSIREGWFQDLLYSNPSLIPIDEIEEIFGPLIPLARELPTTAGPIDIVYISPGGYLTLVETKLFRNPEARREVVAQIIDYASALSGWTYQDLRNAVRLQRRFDAAASTLPGVPNGEGEDPILPRVRDQPDFDEACFIDAVTKNLAEGNLLLLVAGDGIHRGVEQLADTLAAAPSLGFTFALLEIALFKDGGAAGSMVAQPRVLARTREIVRAVVQLRSPLTPREVNVVLPPADTIKPVRITEKAFLDALERGAGAKAADFARWLVARVSGSADLRWTWSKEGPLLRWDADNETDSASILRLNTSGEISATNGLPSFCARHRLPMAIADSFQDGLVALIQGARRVERGVEGYTHVMGEAGARAPFVPLADRRDEFWALITRATAALTDAMKPADE